MNELQQKNIEVIMPEDPEYMEASGVLFAEGSPAIIALPKNAVEVAGVISYARKTGLVVSVRSSGHSAAGYSTNQGGLVIDLKNMHDVTVVDKVQGLVRIGTGARWGEVAHILEQEGLTISSGDTKSVGVGGLLLGGGIGWMVRKYGLTIDSLLAAEVVLADGSIVRASETEHPDLFWAIRGGGGNFGVVTSVELRARAVGKVYSGTIAFSLDNLELLLKRWRDHMRAADEELTTIVNIFPSFAGNPPGAMLTVCYAGVGEKAQKAVEVFNDLGTVTKSDVAEKNYPEVLEEAHPPRNVSIVVKNVIVNDFSDEVIAAIVAARGKKPDMILQIRALGGAIQRVDKNATAFAHREGEALLLSPAFLPPTASASEIEQALEAWNSLAAFGQGSYVNFINNVSEADLSAAYPRETFTRLAAIKKTYDSSNVFSQNINIVPLK